MAASPAMKEGHRRFPPREALARSCASPLHSYLCYSYLERALLDRRAACSSLGPCHGVQVAPGDDLQGLIDAIIEEARSVSRQASISFPERCGLGASSPGSTFEPVQ